MATLVVCFAGLFTAGVLSAAHLLDLPVPCGGSRGCAAVAAHPASRLFGVPIAFFGVGAYVSLIGLIMHAPQSRWTRMGFLVVAGVGAIISAALLAYSQWVIRSTCAWCVASGVCMVLLFGLAIMHRKSGTLLRPASPAVMWGLGILTMIAIGTQAGQMVKASLAPPIPAELLAGVPSADLLEQAHSTGPDDAPVTIILFADLWCPACRAAHASISQYQKANPRGVRLIFRHLPLWGIRGHESSRAAAALSEIAGEAGKFWPFVDALYSHNRQLDMPGYMELMKQLGLDNSDIEARLSDPQDPAIARVLRDEALAERLSINQTPVFILLVSGQQPISANLRTLPKLLNSPVVMAKLGGRASVIPAKMDGYSGNGS